MEIPESHQTVSSSGLFPKWRVELWEGLLCKDFHPTFSEERRGDDILLCLQLLDLNLQIVKISS